MNAPTLKPRYSRTPLLSTLWLFSSVAGLVLTCSGNEPATITQPPNVMIVLADDLGFSDLGCYGSEIATPNLDKLARNGVRFTQFYNTGRCWPTRGALLTGYYAQQIRRDQVDGVQSGGSGRRPSWAQLLPEKLKKLGYRSYHSGKWHIDGKPLEHGFDSSYRLEDHDRHFRPKHHVWNDVPLPAVTEDENYYSSTEIAERTISQWEQHYQAHSDAPFFSFVAFTAPHFPLHAPRAKVEHYLELYRTGWDRMRQDRWKRMADLGLGPTLSATEREQGPPYAFPEAMQKLGAGEVNLPIDWTQLNEEQKAFQVAKIAVHAAMIECMDQEIGRMVQWLQDHKQLENTLILFLSDNGASAEIMVRGDGHSAGSYPGASDSFLCLGPGWSTACNTPFRKHKTWVHEGGICTPCIAHWPAAVPAQPVPVSSPWHVIDVLPTVLEVASGQPFTLETKGSQPSFPGRSFLRVLTRDEETTPLEERVLWWQHEKNRAIRVGDWKLVAAGRESSWELYNLKDDRTESNNQNQQHPEIVERMSQIWETMRADHQATALQTD